jgi:hypothetical protein
MKKNDTNRTTGTYILNGKRNTLSKDDQKQLLESTRKLMADLEGCFRKLIDEIVNEEVGLDYWTINDECCDILDDYLKHDNSEEGVWGTIVLDDTLNDEWRVIFDEFWKRLSDYTMKTKGVRLSAHPLFN